MTLGRLLWRNLFYHWRGNSAVFLGVAVGTAVLTGALLVGDSLRGSLRDQVKGQLGWVDQALVGPRFLREELAGELEAPRACPALLLRGAATRSNEAGNVDTRAGQITILGVDERFWLIGPVPIDDDFWKSSSREVVLNQALAEELKAQPGDDVKLHWQKTGAAPRESLLGRRDASEVVDAERFTVRAVLRDDGLGRFNLNPSAEPARNAFLPLRTLQELLDQQGRVNALLVGGETDRLTEKLREHLTLEDWGLTVREPQTRDRTSRGYLSLESRQLLLEPAVAAAAGEAARATNLRTAPTLVYLANNIATGDRFVASAAAALDPAPTAVVKPLIPTIGPLQIPYSVVAALDPALPPPLGPFLPDGVNTLADDEVVLIEWDGWKDAGLDLRPNAPIALSYFEPEDQGQLKEVTQVFRLRGVIPLDGAADDPNLTPEFRGITDKLTIRDWKPPFPYDNRRVKPSRDEVYWNRHRATPKAYVNLATGQRLWGSRFGQLTSIRLAPHRESLAPPTPDLAQAANEFRRALLQRLRPEQGGLVFDDVRKRGLDASVGGPDFNLYFPGFSAFLITSAVLLVGLLFRLNLDRRGSELGLLLAAGYRRRRVRRLLLAEGTILAAAGGLVGLFGAFLYAWFLLELLRAWWPGAMDRSFLRLHAGFWSFLVGYIVILGVSLLTITWAVRVLGRVSPKSLLAGETTTGPAPGRAERRMRWSLWLAGAAGVCALALAVTGRQTQDHEAQAMSFFGSGALWLTACLAAVWALMRRSRHRRVMGHGALAIAQLGIRNAARHPTRSLLTVGLLASAVFLVVAVESFHRGTVQDTLDPHSGTGGFTVLAESNLPIFQDLNDDDKRINEVNFPDSSTDILRDVRFYGFRLRAGDDASCLNLYQANRPRLLGVPSSLIQLNRFRIQSADEENPWRLLESDADGAIPAFADATTAEFMLKKKIGDTVEVPDENGKSVKLRIVGLLQESVFQSQLLISESNFLKVYPSHEGYNFYLIDSRPERAGEVKSLLEANLAERGFEVTPTAHRLEAYWAVENTYLATFQALGGLGVVLGALGLAVVLLRTIWERRGELALLRALGFRHRALGWLVLAENCFLLVLGLGVGTLAALLAVVPHLARTNGEVPVAKMLELLGLVLIVGMATAVVAVVTSLRAPLVPALRRE
jgi:ABC-type antimicrobial peptide transport system permease subunit